MWQDVCVEVRLSSHCRRTQSVTHRHRHTHTAVHPWTHVDMCRHRSVYGGGQQIDWPTCTHVDMCRHRSVYGGGQQMDWPTWTHVDMCRHRSVYGGGQQMDRPTWTHMDMCRHRPVYGGGQQMDRPTWTHVDMCRHRPSQDMLLIIISRLQLALAADTTWNTFKQNHKRTAALLQWALTQLPAFTYFILCRNIPLLVFTSFVTCAAFDFFGFIYKHFTMWTCFSFLHFVWMSDASFTYLVCVYECNEIPLLYLQCISIDLTTIWPFVSADTKFDYWTITGWPIFDYEYVRNESGILNRNCAQVSTGTAYVMHN